MCIRDRTKEVYASDLTSGGQPQMLRRIKFRCLVALDETVETCFSQRRSEVTVMPIGMDRNQQEITVLHQGNMRTDQGYVEG